MQDEPLIIVLSGPVCAGKSTLAGGLASACGAAALTTRALIAQYIGAAPDELERRRLQEIGDELDAILDDEDLASTQLRP